MHEQMYNFLSTPNGPLIVMMFIVAVGLFASVRSVLAIAKEVSHPKLLSICGTIFVWFLVIAGCVVATYLLYSHPAVTGK